jgi:raffinose/stachyose/melibiose transport system permease protein
MRILQRTAKYAAVIVICLICLVPFYAVLVLALNKPGRVYYEGNMFVPDFHFANFAEAWQKSQIGTAILNSALITCGTLLLIIILGSMAGYAIARFNTRYNKTVFSILIGCMMIPGIINTVPLYTLMRDISGVDTLWGMVLVCSTIAMPSSVFIYAGFIKSLPHELEEAAVIDGCGWFSAFWKVIFPIVKPATASVVVLNGFGIWNNYAQAVFFLQSRKNYNIPQALSVFFQQFAGAKWHLIAATAIIAMIPVIVMFLVFQRYFMKGLTDGAVKG